MTDSTGEPFEAAKEAGEQVPGDQLPDPAADVDGAPSPEASTQEAGASAPDPQAETDGEVTAELAAVATQVVDDPPADMATASVDDPPGDAAAAVEAPAAAVAATVPPTTPPASEPVSHKAPKRRRRWPWVTLACVVVVLLVAFAGVVWYASGLIGGRISSDQPSDPFPLTITSADAGSLSYTAPTGDRNDKGLYGLATVEGGYVQTKDPTTSGSGASEVWSRDITAQVLPPAPAAGQAAELDGWYFPENPKVGLGVDYQDVTYDSPLGPTPAWFIPGTSDTWVIYTHGGAVTPREGLRMAQTVTTLGYPMLLIKYRDDAGAPAEDGRINFGATEWQDLEAAVQYALDNGAKNVVLAGSSLGGAISLAFLQNSPLAANVVGAFLDSPMTNFGRAVSKGGEDMGLPGFVVAAAKQVASWRYGIDWSAVDYAADASSFTIPMVVVQGTADPTVPAEVNEDFVAAANPDLVTLELVDDAGHTSSWNMDRARYEQILMAFLTKVAPPS
jgi:uncharacterized protein